MCIKVNVLLFFFVFFFILVFFFFFNVTQPLWWNQKAFLIYFGVPVAWLFLENRTPGWSDTEPWEANTLLKIYSKWEMRHDAAAMPPAARLFIITCEPDCAHRWLMCRTQLIYVKSGWIVLWLMAEVFRGHAVLFDRVHISLRSDA